MSYLQERKLAFKHALKGIALLRKEAHFKIHLIIAIAISVIGYFAQLNPTQWALQFSAIFVVFISEGINTSIESLSGEITTEYNFNIKIAKDICAGVVLLANFYAMMIAVFIYLPKLVMQTFELVCPQELKKHQKRKKQNKKPKGTDFLELF